ncbi:MAG: hypothetical protein WCL04_09440, partial [Verrucomicrobiota bacterium]
MQRPPETSTLPKLPFVVANVVLLLTAWLIAKHGGTPLTTGTIVAATACVALAAAALCVPFLVDYARQQDAVLDERQRALEALARTTAETAEQISIAAAGLHTITELAQKNLKAAEQLPEQLQEKMAGLNRRLAAAGAAEAEKIAVVADKIAHATAELAMIEAALRKPRASTLAPTPASQAPKSEATAVAPVKADVKPAAPAKEEPTLKTETKATTAAVPPPAAEPPAAMTPVADATAHAPAASADNATAVTAALAAADELLQEISPEEFHTIVPFPMTVAPKPETGAPGQAAPPAKRGKRAKAQPSEMEAKESSSAAVFASE